MKRNWLVVAQWTCAILIVVNGLGATAAVVLDTPGPSAMRFAWGLIGACIMQVLLDVPNWFEADAEAEGR